MTINKKGGKHKHLKRRRNNGGEDRKNPKNIQKPISKFSEYYAIVLKSLGSKRFEIQVVDALWNEKKIIFNVSLRGSKKMRKFRRLLTKGAQNNRLVKIGYYTDISLVDIIHVYEDWESNYLQDEICEDGETKRIILNNEENSNNSIKFNRDPNKKENRFMKKKVDSISIKDLTGIPSSDEEEEEEYNFAALNPQKYKKDKKFYKMY